MGGMRHHATTWELVAIGLAALCGVLHATASLMWGLGSTFLLDTVNDDIVAGFAGRERLLLVVAGVKFAAALVPVWWAMAGWPLVRLSRPMCWAGSAVLIIWGGVSALWAQFVLAGLIDVPDADRQALIGNAFIWDPLFFLWGLALGCALVLSYRGAGSRSRTRPAEGVSG